MGKSGPSLSFLLISKIFCGTYSNGNDKAPMIDLFGAQCGPKLGDVLEPDVTWFMNINLKTLPPAMQPSSPMAVDWMVLHGLV